MRKEIIDRKANDSIHDVVWGFLNFEIAIHAHWRAQFAFLFI